MLFAAGASGKSTLVADPAPSPPRGSEQPIAPVPVRQALGAQSETNMIDLDDPLAVKHRSQAVRKGRSAAASRRRQPRQPSRNPETDE
jgi:hypothetical protein